MNSIKKLAPLKVSQDFNKPKVNRNSVPRSSTFLISPITRKIKKVQKVKHKSNNSDIYFKQFQTSAQQVSKRRSMAFLPINDVKVVNKGTMPEGDHFHKQHYKVNISIETEDMNPHEDSEEGEKQAQERTMQLFYKEVQRKVREKEWAKKHLEFLKNKRENSKYNTNDINSQIQMYREILQHPKNLGKIKK